ncbi:DUF6193 family natural product biosynthesis protein [Streptomyces sp. NPDC058401]|uniref:DUF6193 family natural product biosynthesis protein n=1 Tax=Streptomyces sp. NPDC058401 TaxID=3346480 RepID=UPI0036689D05
MCGTDAFTSHWALRFSTTTRPSLSTVGPALFADGDGTFGVGTGVITPGVAPGTAERPAYGVASRQRWSVSLLSSYVSQVPSPSGRT